jgi:hypothetical protein
VAHPQIAIFARLAKENSQPTRLLAGQKTLLSRTMHDVRYDEIHDELFVTNPFSSAILVFRGGANGEEAPIRIIQGLKTKLGGNDRLEVDPAHNEILTVKGSQILVFQRDANGDVAPIRIVQGPATTMSGEGTLAVDPIHNVLAVAQDTVRQDAPEKAHILFFDRTASGNAKPLGMIKGPKTLITRINQLQIYAPNGWLIAAQPGFYDKQEPEGVFIGIWSIHDNGDVAPRWKLEGPNSVMVKPRGVAIDPKHKALIVGDMRLNAVLTFSFPEIF